MNDSRSAIARAERLLHSGPTNSWDTPSRFGLLGNVLRRLLRRVLRPYEVRQREFESALFAAVAEVDCSPGAGQRLLALAEPLPTSALAEAETPLGMMWVHADDQVTTPALRAGAEWEPPVSALLRRRLQPGATFIDVGANIGYFTVMGCQLVGERGRVSAVECEPRNLAVLKANLWRNGCDAFVLPVAAYSRRGHVSLVVNEQNRGGTAVALAVQSGPLVPCARLDDLLVGWTPDVVKVDVEGTDHLAIEGMASTLRRNPEVIVITEFFPNVADLHGTPPAEVLDLYESLGFEVSLLDDDGNLLTADGDAIFREGEERDYFSIVLQYRDRG
jgi:FkbM family methyltransferase